MLQKTQSLAKSSANICHGEHIALLAWLQFVLQELALNFQSFKNQYWPGE